MEVLKDLETLEDPCYDVVYGLINALREAQRSDHTTQVGAYLQGQAAHNQMTVRDKRAHAESRCIALCARAGVPTHGSYLYAPWAACTECALDIIQAGVRKVYVLKKVMEATPDRWVEEVTEGLNMLLDARVRVIMVDYETGVNILMDGKTVYA